MKAGGKQRSAYFSTLEIEAIYSSETSDHFKRRYAPEDNTVHNHRCEPLKSYEIFHGFPEFLQASAGIIQQTSLIRISEQKVALKDKKNLEHK
jgi:hypothetical protein